MGRLLKYAPLCKVDLQEHTITGIAVSEEPDRDGEVADYEFCKTTAFPTWSQEAADATRRTGVLTSFGNLRWQHGLDIAGKLVAPPEPHDDERAIYITCEPINNDVFQKAARGFVTGYSMGGAYLRRFCDRDRKTDIPEGSRYCPSCKSDVLVRYYPRIAEISLVDSPSMSSGTRRHHQPWKWAAHRSPVPMAGIRSTPSKPSLLLHYPHSRFATAAAMRMFPFMPRVGVACAVRVVGCESRRFSGRGWTRERDGENKKTSD